MYFSRAETGSLPFEEQTQWVDDVSDGRLGRHQTAADTREGGDGRTGADLDLSAWISTLQGTPHCRHINTALGSEVRGGSTWE